MVYRADEILQYYNRNFKEEAKRLLANNGLEELTVDSKREVKIFSTVNMISQREFNKIIFQEMKNINEFCEENNLRILFMKGLTLAQQLYEEPAQRQFNDIDVFLHENDLLAFNLYLVENGYKDENGNEVKLGCIYDYYIPTHLSAFMKGKIMLEVHIMPYYINTLCNDLLLPEQLSDFFENKTMVNIDGTEFPVPENRVNALLLLDHFLKHITFYVKDYTRIGKYDMEVDIEKLSEAAWFIEANSLSFADLFEVAKVYNSVPVLLLSYKYLNELFGFEYPHEDINKYIKERPFYENKLMGKLYEHSLEELIRYSGEPEFFMNMVKTFEYNPMHCIQIPKRATGECGRAFEFDTENPNNIFGTHYQQRNLDGDGVHIKFKGVVNWDENGLNFQTVLRDTSYPDPDGNLLVFKFFKNINIPYYTEILYFREAIFNKTDKSKVYYDFVQEGKGPHNDLKNVMFAGIDKECYACAFSVPWDILGIKPVVGEQLLFEFCIVRKNIRTMWDKIYWGNIDKELDPYTYSVLELTEE